ncbi:LCP family protein [Yinghuangia seranimata]|uniref:LCP family glycopolymer transferase n=1 Tax=Yinghuangia seranimata TaxID=408067 RepID=UPI00248BC364|nr:LCP family protein [Yinghuangia seranimata]MDI2127418.1 LCP family protein [Yinghuangia seranimata]
MTANGERRDGQHYEGGPYRQDGAQPDPAAPGYGYDQGQGAPGQGYPQDPAYGYDQGQGAQYGAQPGYPSAYENQGYQQSGYGQQSPYGYAPPADSGGYPAAPAGYDSTPGYGTGYDQGQAAPGYGTAYPPAPGIGDGYGYDTGQGSGGYTAPQQPGYAAPGGGDPNAYGAIPQQQQQQQQQPVPAPDSGAYGGVPQQPSYPAAAPGGDDSGAYAAFDGRRAPGAGAVAAAPGAAAPTGAPVEPQVRRTGAGAPTGATQTTGSFRVQVPTGGTAAAPGTTPAAPGAAGAAGARRPGESGTAIPGQQRPARPGAPRRPGTAASGPSERVGYAADEFDFVDDDSEESEDVIDWLQFAETRSERRDERRRMLRSRAIVLLVVLAVAGVGVGGYFAYDTWFKSTSAAAKEATGGAVLIQLRGSQGQALAGAVFGSDAKAGTATMLTVPSGTIVNTAGAGPVPVGQLMASDGTGATRDALAGLLGVRIDGSWVVNEPVLQALVDGVGGIELNADVEVKGADGKVVVAAGPNKMNGIMARAYAAFQPQGDDPSRSAERFGKVMQAVLKGLPTKAQYVNDLLRNLANIADPSLPDARLAELLTQMGQAVQTQKFKSGALPIQPDGMLNVATAGPVVKELLGGTVKVAKADGPARVMIGDANGGKGAQDAAKIKIINAGYTYVPGGVAEPKPKPTTLIQYSDDAHADVARQMALTLGVPETAAKKAEGQMLADVVITLGQDFKFDPPKQ